MVAQSPINSLIALLLNAGADLNAGRGCLRENTRDSDADPLRDDWTVVELLLDAGAASGASNRRALDEYVLWHAQDCHDMPKSLAHLRRVLEAGAAPKPSR